MSAPVLPAHRCAPALPARRRTLALFWAVVLAASTLPLGLSGCGGGAAAADDQTGGAGQAPSVLVQTLPLQRGTLPRTVSAYGVVQAAPGAQNSIVAPVAARVTQVYVRAGEVVSAGAALVQLVPSPATQVSYAQAVSALKVASDEVRHTRQLLSEFLATQQQLADAEKAQSDARAALEALSSQGAGGTRTLRAPFQGIVTDVSATVRSLVSEGSPLLDLAQGNGLVLMVGVPPDAAALIAAGDPVDIVPVGVGTRFSGRVQQRGAIVQPDSGLVPVQVRLPPRGFMPGESAQAAITVGTVSGFVVPHDAVLIDDSGSPYVVQAAGDTARVVDVQVLDRQGDREVISGPLDRRQPLVLTGNYQAQNGMKLRFAARQ